MDDTENDRWFGFGALPDAGTREGTHRIREEMRVGFAEDVERTYSP